MPSFFPHHTIELKIEEPQAFRRFSFSLVEMAIVTGVLVRLIRLVALTHGSNNWFYLASTFALGLVFLLGMLTAHLANYPLQQYLWRAPLFAAIEVAAEMATSALLLTVGREANGTVRAHWDDWVGMGLNALLYRGLAIVLWGLILAGVVQLVRRTLVHEDEEPTEATTS
ncbi:MAG TPA: hypothetical protein VGQ56_21565 [Gemmatimonadaceae bacterium]|jgi:hypothetical protein|nr:hypothetical protein [Gemmatimonadaceae bacterium]